MLKKLASLILRHVPHLKLSMVEIGARFVSHQPEPFYELVSLFPGSQIIGFEVDEKLCEKMNAQAPKGIEYYPVALGERNERRAFYVTQHPMCSSLYKPNEDLIALYHHFDVARLDKKTEIDTVSLDHFVKEYAIASVDFIKIDVQGAELDIFKGSHKVLQETLLIVSEVEFIPHYIDQPLFGDVSAYLTSQGFMFHKFRGLSGRMLKPLVINNNPKLATQHIWSDAIFIHHIQHLDQLTPEQLLKLAILACAYGSPDLTFYCLSCYDQRQATQLANGFLKAVAN